MSQDAAAVTVILSALCLGGLTGWVAHRRGEEDWPGWVFMGFIGFVFFFPLMWFTSGKHAHRSRNAESPPPSR